MTDTPTPTPGGEEEIVVSEVSESVVVPGGYPVDVDAQLLPEYSRFMPLIKWLILLPHYIVLFFLGIGAMFVAFIAFFATLFTAKYPEGMWNYMVGVHRWALRVMAYNFLITDNYPPFTLQETDEDTIQLVAEYPERVSRWRPFFAGLICIPYAIVASLIYMVASICSFFAFFTILFTKKIPAGLFNVIRNGFTWNLRAGFYSYWMSTEYPPFEWDED
ncbi:MAG TPA: DUF4389 domain-containing protein [Solirubrobacterales bacterium]|jgi:hypothetical protein|nr:DUF4389 domain-containing protein [Solirubrobacterales bacterium]HMW45676.1 DUF4389 domain-containing protein [Solirubrobacterales bacterium]HMX71661.1 DUF4389 domain-containing protein [Solirubrobacterales bacterium]HNA23401.1 DUF4389 domain-containing protein [Solirubrobacterales bacterium]HNA43254.1 DUF4389 domain-containing protein [Solirubrobacterales bacterium]